MTTIEIYREVVCDNDLTIAQAKINFIRTNARQRDRVCARIHERVYEITDIENARWLERVRLEMKMLQRFDIGQESLKIYENEALERIEELERESDIEALKYINAVNAGQNPTL